MSTPQPHTFPTGGLSGNITCSRCGSRAEMGYEGEEHIDFCLSCFESFKDFMDD